MALEIVFRAEVKNRQLTIDLPDSIVDGEVVQVIVKQDVEPETEITLEEARRRLLAGGSLQTQFGTTEPVEDISDEELEILGKLSEGAPTIGELLDEIRGEY